MSTRALVAIMHGDNAKTITVHWDGYPEGVGSTLYKHYDSVKTNHLISLGDVSSLGPTIGEKHPFSAFDTGISVAQWESLYGDMTTFYGRDRDELNTEFRTFTTFQELLTYFNFAGCEYGYIMRDGIWYTFNFVNKNLRLLSDELAKKALLTN